MTASDKSAFATGAFHTATISNCEKGSIKNLLGLCECDTQREVTSTATNDPTMSPTSNPTEGSASEPVECFPQPAGRYVQFGYARVEPIASEIEFGWKAQDDDWITFSEVASPTACSADCDGEKQCKSFSYREAAGGRAARCILSKSSTTDTDGLVATTAFRHYIVNSVCMETTTAPSTTATTTSTVGRTYLEIVEDAPKNLIGTTCMPELSDTNDQYTVSKCEAMCRAQYECVGFW